MRLPSWRSSDRDIDFDPGSGAGSIIVLAAPRPHDAPVPGFAESERSLAGTRTFFAIYRIGNDLFFSAGEHRWRLGTPGLRFEHDREIPFVSRFGVTSDDRPEFIFSYSHVGRQVLEFADPTYDTIDRETDFFLEFIADHANSREWLDNVCRRWTSMDVVNDIIAARVFGAVRCGLSSLRSPDVSELAREFGLRDDASCYKEIDEAAARHLITSVLQRDLAYNAEVMPESTAAELTDRFMAQFGPGTRFFSNGNWHLPPVVRPDGVVHGASWDAVTSATFDTGVLAIGPQCSGCLWVEDED